MDPIKLHNLALLVFLSYTLKTFLVRMRALKTVLFKEVMGVSITILLSQCVLISGYIRVCVSKCIYSLSNIYICIY